MNRFTIGAGTVILLVLLRVTIGWHFFKEGMSHYNDPKWSSAGFLGQAKGPLADQYRAVLPDPYDWAKPAEEAAPEEPKAPEAAATSDEDLSWKKWANAVSKKWADHRDAFVVAYNLDEAQAKRAEAIYAAHKTELDQYLAGLGDEIDKHLYDAGRMGELSTQATTSELATQKTFVADKQKELSSQSTEWNGQIIEIQNRYHNALVNLLEPEQRESPVEIAAETTTLGRIDWWVKRGLIAVGVCLVVGLFTRLSAVLGGLFLLSVVLAQPPWIAGTVPTFEQCTEMVALFALATTRVGRWAGLDFFIHYLIVSPLLGLKGR